MKPVSLIALAAILLGCTSGCATTCGGGTTLKERPAERAQPYLLAGVCNLHQVSPDLYRSAQPDRRGHGQFQERMKLPPWSIFAPSIPIETRLATPDLSINIST